MFVKELYVMAVINNTQQKSFFIKIYFLIKIYIHILKIIIKRVILFYEDNKHLYKKNLENLINWEHVKAYFYVYFIKLKASNFLHIWFKIWLR